MLGLKRLAYTGQEDPSLCKLSKNDGHSIYECTLNRLLASSSKPSSTITPKELQASSFADGQCSSKRVAFCSHILKQSTSLEETTMLTCGTKQCNSFEGTPCFDCGRSVCELCTRLCDGCQLSFCISCSSPDFNERHDRNFCWECIESIKNNIQ